MYKLRTIINKNDSSCLKFLLGALSIVCVDQIIKIWSWHTQIAYINHNSLFGLKINEQCAIIAITLFLIITRPYYKYTAFQIAISLMIAGIISNSLDRLRWGFVVDYWQFWHIFACNLADISLLLGIVIFIIFFLKNQNAF